jgi:hypothetical protein
MAGILAIVCFIVAYFEHGAALTTSNHWIDSTALTILGLVFLAIHVVVPVARGWLAR